MCQSNTGRASETATIQRGTMEPDGVFNIIEEKEVLNIS